MKALAALFLLMLVTCCPAQTPEPLVVEAPAEWSVEFKGENGLNFYTIKGSSAGTVQLLMFSRWPAGGKQEDIPKMLELMAKGFQAKVNENAQIKGKLTDYKSEEIKGTTFSGQAAVFGVAGGIVQTMFMVGDGEGIWNGQFTGSADGWKQAMGVLQTLKKKP